MMKPTAYLINTSRGPLVDEEALAETLNARALAGAGLDVLSLEPPPADNPLLRHVTVTSPRTSPGLQLPHGRGSWRRWRRILPHLYGENGEMLSTRGPGGRRRIIRRNHVQAKKSGAADQPLFCDFLCPHAAFPPVDAVGRLPPRSGCLLLSAEALQQQKCGLPCDASRAGVNPHPADTENRAAMRLSSTRRSADRLPDALRDASCFTSYCPSHTAAYQRFPASINTIDRADDHHKRQGAVDVPLHRGCRILCQRPEVVRDIQHARRQRRRSHEDHRHHRDPRVAFLPGVDESRSSPPRARPPPGAGWRFRTSARSC